MPACIGPSKSAEPLRICQQLAGRLEACLLRFTATVSFGLPMFVDLATGKIASCDRNSVTRLVTKFVAELARLVTKPVLLTPGEPSGEAVCLSCGRAVAKRSVANGHNETEFAMRKEQ